MLMEARSPDVRVRISALRAPDRPVSMLYNIECRGAVYYLQGGFLPDWDTRVSLGKLHLGYEISRAFAMPQIHRFDLLPGKCTEGDYKASLANRVMPLRTVWVPRSLRARGLALLRRAAHVGSVRWQAYL